MNLKIPSYFAVNYQPIIFEIFRFDGNDFRVRCRRQTGVVFFGFGCVVPWKL